MKLHSDWADFLNALLAHEVEFVLVGGHAVGAYGFSRYTEDLDVYVHRSNDNARRLRAALQAFFGVDVGFTQEKLCQPNKVFMVGEKPYRIDILNAIAGVDFDQVFAKRRYFRIGDLNVPVIGLEELVINKKAAGRPKDLVDAAELEKRRSIPE